MAGVSALLRSASAAYAKSVTLNDDVAAQTFANSAQTADDYTTYKTYLAGRMTQEVDPTKVIALQNKSMSAFTAFTSNEVQRSAINVLEGSGTLQDKQGTILDLYKKAASIGDLNLAQNLRNQYDSIDVEIQNQQKTLASEMATNNVKSLTDLATSYLTGDDPKQASTNPSNTQIMQLYKTQGPEALDKLLTGPDGKTQFNMWDLIYSNVYHAAAAYQAAAQYDSSPSGAMALYDKAAGIINGTTTWNIGGITVGTQDILDAADAARNGQNLFVPSKDASGNNILKKTNITDYVWARDQQGNYRIIQTRNELSQLVTSTADPSNPSKLTKLGGTIQTKLKQAGYDVIGVENGQIRVRQTTTGKGGTSAIPGTRPGDSFLVSYDNASGDLRLESAQTDPNNPGSHEIYAISLHGDATSNTDFGGIYKVNAADETFFSNPNIGSTGSFNPAAAPKLASVLPPSTGGPAVDMGSEAGTSNLLFTNGAARQTNMERIAAATAKAVQSPIGVQNASPGFDIQALNVPAGARLTVNNMPNPQNISLAKPAALPNLSVNNAPPTSAPLKVASAPAPSGGLSVSNAPSNQSISVK